MKDLTNYEMQELLPDYAFGKLEPELKSIFEYNISKYPDIKEELIRVQAVFAKVEAANFDAIFSKRTRNLSVAVNSRLARKSNKSVFNLSQKFAYPIITAFVMAIGFYWMFQNNTKTDVSKEKTYSANSRIETFTDKDLGLLIDSSSTEQEIQALAEEVTDNSNLGQDDISQFNEQVLDKVSLQLVSENVMNKIDKPADVGSIDNYVSYYSFLDNADEIGEENFQYILKELQDENF
jgi:hypothetical protein